MIKVKPKEDDMLPKDERRSMQKSKVTAGGCFLFSIWGLASLLGLLPYQIDKQSGAWSFKWLSLQSLTCLAKLTFFSFPLTILPTLLFGIFADKEWDEKTSDGLLGGKNGTIDVGQIVQRVDYFSSYAYFFLS